jgi:hypothetical protein
MQVKGLSGQKPGTKTRITLKKLYERLYESNYDLRP